MTVENRHTLAQAYQAAWFARFGEAITVKVGERGMFFLKDSEGRHMQGMKIGVFLNSLARMTLALASDRKTADTIKGE